MQARLKLEEAGRQVDRYLNDSYSWFDNADSQNSFYSGLIGALNRLTRDNVVDKSLRAEYRERLSEALRKRITKALNTKRQSALNVERLGLVKVIKEVAILQGSGGFFGLAKQKTAVQDIQGLIVELENAIVNPKIEQLFKAVHNGDYDLVYQLIKEGVEVNDQTTLLDVAVRNNDVGIVRLLLRYKVNANQADRNGEAPLYLAARLGHVKVVSALINEDVGVDVNQGMRGDAGDTALFAAIAGGHGEVMIRLLLNAMVKQSISAPENKTIYSSLIATLNHEALKTVYAQRPDLRQTHCAWLVQALSEKNSWNLVNHQEIVRGLHAIIEEDDLFKIGEVALHQRGCDEALLALIRLKRLIERLENRDADESTRTKALLEAAKMGDLEKVSALIQLGVPIDCQDEWGHTPLYVAAEFGRQKVVQVLLENNANINLKIILSAMPLYAAARSCEAGIIKALIEKGADYNQIIRVFVDRIVNGVSAGSNFGIFPHCEAVVKLLLNSLVQKASLLADQAAQPATSPENETIYSLLIATLNSDELKPIYKKSKVFRAEIRTWLAEALTKKASTVVTGDPENIEAELKGLRAIINEVDFLKGASSLLHEKSAVTTIKQCIEKLEAALEQRKAIEVGPSKALFEAAIEGDLEKVKVLIEKGVDVNCQDELGRTPLYRAAGRGRVAVVEFLISQKANINQAKNNGATPLYIAALKGYVKIVQLLLENNAEVNQATSSGATPLFIAAYNGHKKIVQVLLQNDNVAVNQARNSGATPLFVAAQNGHEKVVQVLLENNAAVNQARNTGATPLYIAAQNGHVAVIDLFKVHLNKKIRSHLFEENGKLVASPQCYNNLIAYLNHQCTSYNKLKSTRKATRLFLTTALHERVNEVMTPAKPDNELLKNEKAGLDLMIKSLELFQSTGSALTKKHAMKEIEGWSTALGVKIEHPDLAVTIDPPRAQKKSLTGAMYATLFGGSAQTPQVDSEQAIVPSRPDGSAQAFYSSL